MRWLRENRDLREVTSGFDGARFETRFFRVSKETFEWLEEHGSLAAICLHVGSEIGEPGYWISVAAEVYLSDDGTFQAGWNGWSWLHDEFKMAGLNPRDFG